jgi:hypothetical protein
MSDVPGLLKRAAERCGFVRERFNEGRIPTDISNVVVLPLFADLRNTFVASSLLAGRYRSEERGSKYFIVASWPGQGCLYPYADEFWSVEDGSANKRLYQEADGFGNRSDLMTGFAQGFNNHFIDVLDPALFKTYYHNGLTADFFRRFQRVERTLPMVPSVGALTREFNRDLANRAGFKVFLYPSLWAKTWRLGREAVVRTQKDFYLALAGRLLKHKYVPVVWRSPWTHDLSPDLPTECVYVTEPDLGRMLGVMRAVGCVLDVFSGVSRLAMAARCPFLACDERQRYAGTREWEIDDLCGPGVPKQYLFSFSTILDGPAGSWDNNLFNNIVSRLDSYLPGLNRDAWPSTGASTEVVPYDSVRQKKIIKIGAKLFRVPKE